MFSDVTGKTCTEVIDNVLAGNTDPEFLASLCTHWRLKSSQKEIALAVEGNFTEHHKFMLRAIRKSIENASKTPTSQEEINIALGNAHFWRAYAYFYLVRVFGPLPMVLKTIPMLPPSRPKQSPTTTSVVAQTYRASS